MVLGRRGMCMLAMGVGAFLSAAGAFSEDAAAILNPGSGKVFFVNAASGKNGNAGTKEAPLKDIDAAFDKAADGDTVVITEGVYMGKLNIGYMELSKSLKLYGGFSPDFSKRDVRAHPTLVQPDNASGGKSRKALLTLKKVDGVVIDGIVFDMGARNSYSTSEGKPDGVETGMLLLPPAKSPGENATVEEPIISIPSATPGGNLLIQNNVFVNGANFALQGGLRSGTYRILNNVFVSNRMAAIEIFGTSASDPSGEAEIAYNTVLFTWSRLKDFGDMGYGIRIMTKVSYRIHHNIVGTAILTGIDHSRFAKDASVALENNVFFANKQSDMQYSPASNTKLNLDAGQFEELSLASTVGNANRIPAGLPVDKGYLAGFLAARYSAKEDYDPNSSANRMRELFGLNKQATVTSTISMFANRYPWRESLKLFGAASGVGAQLPQ